MKPLVIYHGNCADGFSAAWCFWHKYGDACEYFAGVYGQLPPDVTGRCVYLVDFCYHHGAMLRMLDQAAHVVLIDHHKTAIEEMAGVQSEKFSTFVDLERSGATLAWDFLFPGQPRPLLLGHVEDRDLWRFKLPGTREVQAYVFSHDYTFEQWDRLMTADQVELLKMTAAGAALERKHRKDVAELVRVATRDLPIAGRVVPVCNLPYTMASDGGELLAAMCRDRWLVAAEQLGESPAALTAAAFGATYYDTAEHRQFSLRSLADGADVGVIAQRYGGGGHRHAAGFRVDRSHPLALA